MCATANQKLDGMRDYKQRYALNFDVEKDWLSFNAVERANSVQALVEKAGLQPDSILDLGCGTGAILRELQRRNIGKRYTGIDYSEEAIAYLQQNSRGIDSMAADVASPEFCLEGRYDLVLIIHVLQHLEDPAAFLDAVLEKIDFSYLLIEIPFEDTLLNRLVPLLLWRKKNPAGSLQFFNGASFERLLRSKKLATVGDRRYAPLYGLDTIRVLKERYGWSNLQYWKKIVTAHVLPRFIGPIKMRIHYSHYAVLGRKA